MTAKNRFTLDALLLLSFFISGCSALIYQVCWQRSLYGVIGVDMDSITIIVSVFMLGIGMGGMIGGWLSDHYPVQRLGLYAGAELSIALYGASSLWLLQGLETGDYVGWHWWERRRYQCAGLFCLFAGAHHADGGHTAALDHGF